MSPSEHGPFYPTARPYCFIILAFTALMAFGSYFAYDSVGAIETTLIQVFHTDRAAIGTMYTMYSAAAVFAVLAGGFLIDLRKNINHRDTKAQRKALSFQSSVPLCLCGEKFVP